MNESLLPVNALPMEAASPLFPTDDVGLSNAAPFARAAGMDGAGGFARLFTDGLAQVNQGLIESQAGMQRVALGDMSDVHQVMVQLEESRLGFQLLMQVRGRLLEAYQDVMRMQI